MVRGRWSCRNLGSRGFGSRGGGSSSGQSYKLVDEAGGTPLDDPAPTAPLGDDMDQVAQPDGDGDAIETQVSRRQPRGPNRPHTRWSQIPSALLFHLIIGR